MKTPHLDDRDFEEYTFGRMPAELKDAAEEHLLVCALCRDGVAGEDRFVGTIRTALRNEPPCNAKAVGERAQTARYFPTNSSNFWRWLARHPRFHVHFTPTSASWLNMVERFFPDLTEHRLRRGVFHDVEELILAIDRRRDFRISDVSTFHIDRMQPTGEIHVCTTKAGTHVYTWVPEWLQERLRVRSIEIGPTFSVSTKRPT